MSHLFKNIKWSAFTVGHFLLLSVLLSCNQNPKVSNTLTFLGDAMGTKYKIKVITNDSETFQLQSAVDSILAIFNASVSTYDTNSLISKFNRNQINLDSFKSKANAIELTQLEQFLKVCYRSFDVYTASGGAFDPGAGPIYKAWGFAEQKMFKVPAQAYIDSCLVFAKYNQLELLDGIPVKKDPRLTLNFNAIAKGYGVDVIANYLEELGIENYMVEIGGEVRCKGKNSKNEFWTIGINVPSSIAKPDDAQAVLQIKNRSLATSGNYRQYFEENGKKYAHTIDPRTGYPAQNELLSASILANDCMTADAFATACMVLGKDKCLDLVKKDTTLDVFLLFNDEKGEVQSVYSHRVAELLPK
jgi:thiamine biosynthesis lipoprotein